MRLLIVLFSCIPLIFIVVGSGLAIQQHHRLVRYEPVEATVLSTDVDRRSTSDGTTFRPIVRYSYSVEGEAHTSDEVHPLRMSRSSRSWAIGIINQ